MQTNYILLLVVYVAVIFFIFLISLSVLAIVATIFVQGVHLRSETKPLKAMPAWVSTDNS